MVLTQWSSGRQWRPIVVTPVSLHIYGDRSAAGWPARASPRWEHPCLQQYARHFPPVHNLTNKDIMLFWRTVLFLAAYVKLFLMSCDLFLSILLFTQHTSRLASFFSSVSICYQSRSSVFAAYFGRVWTCETGQRNMSSPPPQLRSPWIETVNNVCDVCFSKSKTKHSPEQDRDITDPDLHTLLLGKIHIQLHQE